MRADEYRRLEREMYDAGLTLARPVEIELKRIVSRMVDDARRESYGAGLGAAQAVLAGAQNPYELKRASSCSGGTCCS